MDLLLFFSDSSNFSFIYASSLGCLADFQDEDFDDEQPTKGDPFKAHGFPVFPKEEEMDEEEYDRLMEERYASGSSFAAHAGEEYDDKTFELNSLMTVMVESMPTIDQMHCTTYVFYFY